MAKRRSPSEKAPRDHGVVPGPGRAKRVRAGSLSENELAGWQRAQQVLEAHRVELLALPGVAAVEVAPRIVGGVPGNVPSIRVHVYRKRARDNLSPNEILPERIDGVPVDVVPATFRATGCEAVAAPLLRRWPRLQGGVAIGSPGTRSIATFAMVFLSAESQDVVLGLTAGHAFEVGQELCQPAGGGARDVFGRVLDAEVSESIDAATIELDRSARPLATGVAGAGGPVQMGQLPKDAPEYLPVFMTGGCSGQRVGWARRSSEPIPIDYPSGQIWMDDHIHIVSGMPKGPFNRGGDSGAMLLSQKGDLAFGLIIAAGEFEGKWLGIATPIERVVAHFGLILGL